MSYVAKNLLPGETVLCTGSLHWIIYLKPLLLVAFGVFLLALPAFMQVPEKLWIWGAVAIAVGGLAAIPALLSAWSTELVVTSVRIIAKHGLISRRTTEMLHRKIESLSVHQSIPGRLLNYGTLVIHGTGGGQESIPNIARPLDFRNAATAAQSTTGS
ncbi:PH domain-containing protein [Nevskia soli]|uniref:PH domain-containing protein n=1 Tax=Nevskia soli TaxID=418856 RepID=UPI0004A73305|nr:PH domain-containing protein [Nevskia soli]